MSDTSTCVIKVMTKKLLVCTNYRANPNNPSCAARGSKQILSTITQQLHTQNVSIEVEEIQCMGFCKVGPNLRLIPNGAFFHEVTDKKIAHIIKAAEVFLKK
jgi:NADH:ubiquinone oxidoreductase subunit E